MDQVTDGTGRARVHQPAAEQPVEVTVTGELDLSVVPRLGPLLDAAVARRPVRLVVDLTACRHVDAAGIALLLDVHRRLWRTGGQVVLRRPSRRVRGILEIAQVDHVLPVEADSPGTAAETPASGAADPRGHRLP